MRPKSAINVEEMEVIHLNEIDPKLIPDHVIEMLYRAMMPAIAEMEKKKEEEMSKNAS